MIDHESVPAYPTKRTGLRMTSDAATNNFNNALPRSRSGETTLQREN